MKLKIEPNQFYADRGNKLLPSVMDAPYDIDGDASGLLDSVIAKLQAAADSINAKHREHLASLLAMVPTEHSEVSKALAVIQSGIDKHEKALAGAVVSFASELEELRAASKVQNLIYGLGLDAGELVERLGDDVKALEAARRIFTEIGNDNAAKKLATEIESVLAPDSRAEILRLRKQSDDIQRFVVGATGKMCRDIARTLDGDFRSHDMAGFVVTPT